MQQKIGEIRASKNLSKEEQERRLAGYAPFMQPMEQYVANEIARQEAIDQLSFQQIAAQGLSAHMQANMPTAGRPITRLGRSVNAALQQGMQMVNGYARADLTYRNLDNQYTQALRAGEIDKAEKLMEQRDNALYARDHFGQNQEGILGAAINRRREELYNDYSKAQESNEYKEARTNLVNAEKTLRDEQDKLNKIGNESGKESQAYKDQ